MRTMSQCFALPTSLHPSAETAGPPLHVPIWKCSWLSFGHGTPRAHELKDCLTASGHFWGPFCSNHQNGARGKSPINGGLNWFYWEKTIVQWWVRLLNKPMSHSSCVEVSEHAPRGWMVRKFFKQNDPKPCWDYWSQHEWQVIEVHGTLCQNTTAVTTQQNQEMAAGLISSAFLLSVRLSGSTKWLILVIQRFASYKTPIVLTRYEVSNS